METCSIEGCERKHKARGLCEVHYFYYRRRGELDKFPRTLVRDEEKLQDVRKFAWENSEQLPWTGCWIWMKGVNAGDRGGYARTVIKGKTTFVSRLILGIHRSSVEMVAMHTCDQPLCVNPDHLHIGSRSDNTQDMLEKGRSNRAKGEQSGAAVLTEKQVLAIRKEYEVGNVTQVELGDKYGVTQDSISDITRRKSWKHI